MDKENKTTHVVQQIDEGDLKYVKEITVTGNDVTRDDVVRREIFQNPGERFDGGLLEASHRRLEGSEYYDTVRFSTQDISDDPLHSDLLVDVDEGKTVFFTFGAWYNTDEGIGGYTELRFNNFDIPHWPTFQGGAQQLRPRWVNGATGYSLSFSDPEIFVSATLQFEIYDDRTIQRQDGLPKSRRARVRFGKYCRRT